MRLFLLCFLLYCRALYAAPCDDIESVLRFLDETHTLSLDFVQSSADQRVSGHLWAKKSGRFRLDVQGRDPLSIVSDGHMLWNFSPVLAQVIQQRVGHFVEQSPLIVFLNSRPVIAHFFVITLSQSLAHTCVVTFTPKRSGTEYRWVRLSLFDTGLPRALEMVGALDHKKIKMVFSHVQRNQRIEDRFFVFHVPPNVDVVNASVLLHSP